MEVETGLRHVIEYAGQHKSARPHTPPAAHASRYSAEVHAETVNRPFIRSFACPTPAMPASNGWTGATQSVALQRVNDLRICPLDSGQVQRSVEFALGGIDGGVVENLDVGAHGGVADTFVACPHV